MARWPRRAPVQRALIGAAAAILALSLPAGAQTWAKRFTGTGNFEQDVMARVASDGAIFCLGKTYISSGTGYYAYLRKLDASGTPLWETFHQSSSFGEKYYDLELTSDGGVIAVGTTTYGVGADKEYHVVKFTSAGAVQWVHQWGGDGDDEATSVEELPGGGYVLTGRSSSNLTGTCCPTGNRATTLRLDASGNILWMRQYGHDLASGEAVTRLTDGSLLLLSNSYWGGTFPELVKLSLSDGSVVWRRPLGAMFTGAFADGKATSDGGALLLYQAEYTDFVVVKVDGSGTFLWGTRLPTSDLESPSEVIPTSDGGCIAAGNKVVSGAGTQGWLVKLDAAGTVTWQKAYGLAGYETFYSVSEVPGGGYLAAGITGSFGGGNSSFLVRTDAAGDVAQFCELVGATAAPTEASPSMGDDFAGSTDYPATTQTNDTYFAAKSTSLSDYPLCGFPCQVPSGVGAALADDVHACQDSGVLVQWPQDPSDWGDQGYGTRRYKVMRDGGEIATVAYGTTSYNDLSGTNNTPYTYGVRYENGCHQTADSATAQAQDHADPLTATAGASPDPACLGTAVTFSGGPTCGKPPYTHAWDFEDDGAFDAATQDAEHTYPAAGTHPWRYRVTDAGGASVDVTGTATTWENPAAAPVLSPDPVCLGEGVQFSANPSGGTPPYTFLWTFGDGQTSTLQDPVHTYGATGDYAVAVTVTDSHGCTSGTVAVAGSPVTVSAQSPPCSGCTPLAAPAQLTVGGQFCSGAITVAQLQPLLAWEDVAGESGYEWELLDACGGGLLEGGTTGAGVTDATPAAPLPLGDYAWRIRAKGDGASTCDSDWTCGCPFSVDGTRAWIRAYGGTGADTVRGGGGTSDGGAVVLASTSSFGRSNASWFLRMDGDGTPVWQVQNTTASTNFPYYLDAKPDGESFSTGTRYVSAGALNNATLTRMDAAGTHLWTRYYGTSANDNARGVRVQGDHALLAAYSQPSGADFYPTLLEIDASGAIVRQVSFDTGPSYEDIGALCPTPDGGVALGLTTHAGTVGGGDLVVVKLDADWAVEWSTWLRLDGTTEFPQHLSRDAGGYLLVATGDFLASYTYHPWLVRLNASGGLMDQRFLYEDSVTTGNVRGASDAPGGGVFLGATFSAACILKVETDLSVSWGRKYAGLSIGGLSTGPGGAIWSFMGAPTGVGAGSTDLAVGKLGSDGLSGGGCAYVSDITPTAVATAATAQTPALVVSAGAFTASAPSFTFGATTATVTDLCEGLGAFAPTEVSPPGAGSPLAFPDASTLIWQDASGNNADTFNLYRGTRADLEAGTPLPCLQSGLATNEATDSDIPGPLGLFYLVTGVNGAGEGTAGQNSSGVERAVASCP